MRGKKGVPHPDPADPPRRRGNKRRGHGTFANDRPPVVGVVGREAGRVRLEVVASSGGATPLDVVERATAPGVTLNTAEWVGYAGVAGTGREHRHVGHRSADPEWARDDDGDGVREVHNTTMESTWVGLRNFLRPFRGVSKWFLRQYVAIFAWGYNRKRATADFLRALLGIGPTTTDLPT